MILAYAINLERATERRSRICAQLDRLGIPYRVFPAVDGRRLTEDDIQAHYDEAAARVHYRPLSRGELGCALSHLGVYKQMLSDGVPFALVLEDDAALDEALVPTLAALESTIAPEQPEAVLLSHVDKFTRWGLQPLDSERQLVRRYGHWWRAHGYVVTRAAAERLVASLDPVWCAADCWSTFERRGLIGVRAVVPYCIGLNELASSSSMEDHRAPLDAADKARRPLKYYLRRYLWQRFLFQLVVRPFLRVAKQKSSW